MKTRHKKTCAVCGFPRKTDLHTKQCKLHCPGCRQPYVIGQMCPWCCKGCGQLQCVCVQEIFDDEDGDYDSISANYDDGDGGCTACADSDCACHEDHYCGYNHHGGSKKVIPAGKTATGMGQSGYATGKLVPPWEESGIKAFPFHKAETMYDSAEEAWPDMRCEEVDPVQRAADFYVLSAISSKLLNSQGDGACPVGTVFDWHPELTGAFREAKERLHDLVVDTDRSFRAYIDMACGGELRHHPRVGSYHLNANRAKAWVAWRTLREVRGVEALMDAYWLFNDFTQGGYGGPLWAGAAELLYKRLTGRITMEVFVDQTFSLVHNGGVFLNKKHWNIKGGKDLSYLQKSLLPAQARDDWQTLLDVSSPSSRALWREGWLDTNKARVHANMRPTPVPGLESRLRRRCNVCHLNPSVGHLMFKCKDGQYVERLDRRYCTGNTYNHPFPNWDSSGKVLRLYEGKRYVAHTTQRALALRKYSGALQDVLDHEQEWKGLSRLLINDKVVWEFNMVKPATFTLSELLELHGVRVEMIPLPEGATAWTQQEASYIMDDDDDDNWYDDDE